MTSQTTDLQVLLDRLERVERENRKLKRAVFALMFLIGAVFILTRAGPSRRVVAEEVALRYADGKRRAKLEMVGTKPCLTELDSQWTARTAPIVNRQSTIGNSTVQPSAHRQSLFANSVAEVALAGESPRPIVMVNRQSSIVNSTSRQTVARANMLIPCKALEPEQAPGRQKRKQAFALQNGSTHNRQSSDANSDGFYRTDPGLRAHLFYPSDLVGALPWKTHAAPALEPAPELGTRLSNTSNVAERLELPAPTRLRPLTDASRGKPPLSFLNNLEARWKSVQQSQSHELARLTRNPFEFVPGPGSGRAHAPLSVVKTAPASAPSPLPAADPPPGAPPVALKAIGYTERDGAPPQAVVAGENSIYVVEEGGRFADRFRVLKVTPTVVEIEDELAHQRLSLGVSP